MRMVHEHGHEVGIHCYDHIEWQDNLFKMSDSEVRRQVNLAVHEFETVFGFKPKTMGAAGWQASPRSLAAYDIHELHYASDTRGDKPFYPSANGTVFKTVQLPSTLPTLDELIGRPEYPMDKLIDHFLGLIKPGQLNVFTLHAELEGMMYLDWFKEFLVHCIGGNIKPMPLEPIAEEILKDKRSISTLELLQGTVDGRSGTLAMHAA
jgi:peptidoglycan/xylan/chitin deacetylase (PgdA/CDA1 family)